MEEDYERSILKLFLFSVLFFLLWLCKKKLKSSWEWRSKYFFVTDGILNKCLSFCCRGLIKEWCLLKLAYSLINQIPKLLKSPPLKQQKNHHFCFVCSFILLNRSLTVFFYKLIICILLHTLYNIFLMILNFHSPVVLLLLLLFRVLVVFSVFAKHSFDILKRVEISIQ